MIKKLHKIIILFFLFVFLNNNIIAYEYEFVGFIDHDRPRLTDNPASISQMDADYFEIEPTGYYSRDDDTWQTWYISNWDATQLYARFHITYLA